MIIPETKTAFVHIPKTAGTSICQALLPHDHKGRLGALPPLLNFLEEHLTKNTAYVRPMIEFVDRDIDDIFRYEQLYELETKLGITLEYVNETKPWQHHRQPNKKRAIQYIKQKYREDFLRFNYEL